MIIVCNSCKYKPFIFTFSFLNKGFAQVFSKIGSFRRFSMFKKMNMLNLLTIFLDIVVIIE